MTRIVLRVAVAGVLVFAMGCSREGSDAPGASGATRAGSAPASGAPASGAPAPSLVAADKITDACTVMPVDLAKKIVPGGGAPQSQPLPPRCTISNGTAVLEITFDSGPPTPVQGAEAIPGLANGGYLERPAPDDAYLAVILGRESEYPSKRLLVEVAGHDGKDHKEDAIAVAREVLAKLK